MYLKGHKTRKGMLNKQKQGRDSYVHVHAYEMFRADDECCEVIRIPQLVNNV